MATIRQATTLKHQPNLGEGVEDPGRQLYPVAVAVQFENEILGR